MNAGEVHAGPPAGTPDAVWVRRCRSCGADDLSAAFGQPALATRPWSCPSCAAGDHVLVRRPFPTSAAAAACPYRGAA